MRGDGYVPYSEEGGFLSGRDPAPGCLPALECVPPHARETLRSGLYWRGVGVAVVEIVGAVAAWRGLWNLGDALLGTAPGADAAHAALGLAVVAKTNVHPRRAVSTSSHRSASSSNQSAAHAYRNASSLSGAL